MRYRSRTDIIAEILELAKEGKNKTRLMYQVYLSFTQLNDYLPALLANDFLEYDKKEKIYNTTTKGLDYLEKIKDLGDMLDTKKTKKKTK